MLFVSCHKTQQHTKIVKIVKTNQNIRRSMHISEKYDKIIIDADVDK